MVGRVRTGGTALTVKMRSWQKSTPNVLVQTHLSTVLILEVQAMISRLVWLLTARASHTWQEGLSRRHSQPKAPPCRPSAVARLTHFCQSSTLPSVAKDHFSTRPSSGVLTSTPLTRSQLIVGVLCTSLERLSLRTSPQ